MGVAHSIASEGTAPYASVGSGGPQPTGGAIPADDARGHLDAPPRSDASPAIRELPASAVAPARTGSRAHQSTPVVGSSSAILRACSLLLLGFQRFLVLSSGLVVGPSPRRVPRVAGVDEGAQRVSRADGEVARRRCEELPRKDPGPRPRRPLSVLRLPAKHASFRPTARGSNPTSTVDTGKFGHGPPSTCASLARVPDFPPTFTGCRRSDGTEGAPPGLRFPASGRRSVSTGSRR